MEDVKQTTPETSSLRIGLFDPGMSILHRVGLGGLALTLAAIERQPDLAAALHALGGDWTRTPHAVTFNWTGDGTAFFARLITESFRLTPDGRIWFLGLGAPSDQRDQGITLQDALLATFLQHGPTLRRAAKRRDPAATRGTDPANTPGGAITVELDGDTLLYRYRRVFGYPHQVAGFDPRKPKRVVGWQFPGGAVRHTAFEADTALVETPGAWLTLLFAPVGAIYFRVERRAAGIRPQYCLALPDVADLERYAAARSLFAGSGFRELTVAGAADAALRVLAELEAFDLLDALQAERCQVMSFGIVPWAPQQKTRIHVLTVADLPPAAFAWYRVAEQASPPLRIPESKSGERQPGRPLFQVSPVLDLVAGNLVAGRSWYRGFTGLMTNLDQRRQLSSYEWNRRRQSRTGGLSAMVNTAQAFDSRAAEIIVRACHEAWRRRLGQLSEEAKARGADFRSLAERERDRLRTSLAHAKNATTLRAALTDFWSRAGTLPPLQEGWREVLPYLAGPDWEVARDLALLALASYAAPEPEAVDDDDTGMTQEEWSAR